MFRGFEVSRKRALLYICIAVLLASAAAAQTTTVTGTVVDPNGVAYSNGTILPVFVANGGSPIFTSTGAFYVPPTTPTQLSSTGAFSMRLADNALLSPAGSKWKFVISCGSGCMPPAGGTGPQSFTTAAITITGASQSITANINAVPVPALTVVAGTGHTLSAALVCAAASASGTAYTCATSPTFTPAANDMIVFVADVANTGSATLAVNGATAATIKKTGGGTNLAANDLLAAQTTLLVFDGTNWQMQGQSGAPLNAVGTNVLVKSDATGKPGASTITDNGAVVTITHAAVVGTADLTLADNGGTSNQLNLFLRTARDVGDAEISTNAGNLHIYTASQVSGIDFQGSSVTVRGAVIRPSTAGTPLGEATLRFGNLFLSGLVQSGMTIRLTSDLTLAANTSLQTIFSWTLPSSAFNWSFHCNLPYSQATAAVADAFGIQAATNAATRIDASGDVNTSSSVKTSADLTNLTTTTATNVITFTPSATATVFHGSLDGTIQAGASPPTINIMASQSNSADLLTIKAGAYCAFTP